MDYKTEIPKTYSTAASAGLLFLRVIPFSMLPVFHGWEKLIGAYGYLFDGKDWMFVAAAEKLGFPHAPYFAVASALAESLICVLLIAGLLTRFSAAIVTFNFMVAAYHHLLTDWKFEMAGLYLAPAIALLFLGAGGISLDAMIKRRFRGDSAGRISDEFKVRGQDSKERAPKLEVSEPTDEVPRKPESRL